MKKQSIILIVIAVIIIILISGYVLYRYYSTKGVVSLTPITVIHSEEKPNYIPPEASGILNLDAKGVNSLIRSLSNGGSQYVVNFPVTDPTSTIAMVRLGLKDKGFTIGASSYDAKNKIYSLGGINHSSSTVTQKLQLFILPQTNFMLSTSTSVAKYPWVGIFSLYNYNN